MGFVTIIDRDGVSHLIHTSRLAPIEQSEFKMKLINLLDEQWRKVVNDGQAFIDDDTIYELIDQYYTPK
jgi:hypothetical protein